MQKCVCGRDSIPDLAGGASSTPRLLAGGEGARFWSSALIFVFSSFSPPLPTPVSGYAYVMFDYLFSFLSSEFG